MRYETPHLDPLRMFAPYDGKREIGAAAPACPQRPWWWLAVAFAAGGAAAYSMTKPKKGGRGGRIE
jgi:hypothetical protein